MSINVNRQATQSNIAIEQNKTQKQKDTSATDTSKAASSTKDSVQITPQAMNLNKIQKQTSSESQVNMKRVETLKAAILNGDYKINTERLAEKLGKFESDFSSAFPS